MFAIQKINKRLHIMNGGKPIYSPPGLFLCPEHA